MQEMVFAKVASRSDVATKIKAPTPEQSDQPKDAFAKLMAQGATAAVEDLLPAETAPDSFHFAPGMLASVPLDAPINIPSDGDEFVFGTPPEVKLAKAVQLAEVASSAPQKTETVEPDMKPRDVVTDVAETVDVNAHVDVDTDVEVEVELNAAVPIAPKAEEAKFAVEGFDSATLSETIQTVPETIPYVEDTAVEMARPNIELASEPNRSLDAMLTAMSTGQPIAQPVADTAIPKDSVRQITTTENLITPPPVAIPAGVVAPKPISNIFVDDDVSGIDPVLDTEKLSVDLPKTAATPIKPTNIDLPGMVPITPSQILTEIGTMPGADGDNVVIRETIDTQIRSVSPSHSPTPNQTPHIVTTQIAAAISQTASNDIEIRLDPEELGKLRIMLTPKDGGYDVMIIADREQTLELIKRNAAALSDQFEQMGYEGSTLNFASSQNPQTPQDDESEQQIFIPLSAPTFGPRMTIQTDGLDIRY